MTDRKLGIAIAVLGFIGLGIATYLTYVHYAHLKPICTTGGCEVVQNSQYATFAGIPVPVLGLVGWIGILFSLLIPGDLGRAATALLGLFGFGFSVYLTYLEIFKIKAICQWCVANAVIMTLVMIISVVRLWRYQPPTAATLKA
ncbi:MAG: vitamin K epoxide reductase family protein [Thermoleophilaceae bacterium]|nr:vitamin K epoxide reductase family protein [Thermoleophilaceae bacterium]